MSAATIGEIITVATRVVEKTANHKNKVALFVVDGNYRVLVVCRKNKYSEYLADTNNSELLGIFDYRSSFDDVMDVVKFMERV